MNLPESPSSDTPLPSPPSGAPAPRLVPEPAVNLTKIDDAVLALLHLTSFIDGTGAFRVTRTWKGHDWEALNRLHEQGLISNPKTTAKSVLLTEEGARLAALKFRQLMCD